MVLSIISAITSGILTLISVVDIFGTDRQQNCNWDQHYDKSMTTKPTNHTLLHTSHLPTDPCCSDIWQEIEGCYTNISNDWGMHTLIHLPLALAMLACSIISASLTCITRENTQRGIVWGTQQGGFPHNSSSTSTVQLFQQPGSQWPPP